MKISEIKLKHGVHIVLDDYYPIVLTYLCNDVSRVNTLYGFLELDTLLFCHIVTVKVNL